MRLVMIHRAGSGARAVVVCASMVALAPSVRAQSVGGRSPIRTVQRHVGTFDYVVAMVDLRDPRVRFVTTDESFVAPAQPGGVHRWRTTSEFARETGAALAVNANYYDIHHGALTTCGMSMSQGRAWQTAYIDRRLECWWTMGFGRHRAEVFDSHGKVFGPAPDAWMTEAVTGSPRVIAEGVVLKPTFPRHATSRNPRTVIGLDRERTTFYAMVVNGREGANQGMTCEEAGRALRGFGAWDAVNLDGGGSSAMYVRARHGLANRPSDHFERPVANHLGVVIDDAPTMDVEVPAPEIADDVRVAAAPVVPAPVTVRVRERAPRVASAAVTERAVLRAGCDVSSGATKAGGLWAAMAALVTVGRRRRR